MLVSGRFLFVRSFPALQIPNFKASAVAYESDFVFQCDLLAKIIRQYQPTLPVRGCVLSPRMQLSEKNAAIARGNFLVGFRGRAQPGEFHRRHHKQKLVSRLRQQDEFLRMIASPPRWNSDPILVVDGMLELSSVEAFGLGIGIHGRVE